MNQLLHEDLPALALNIARRVKQLSEMGDGKHTLELIFFEGAWLLIVDGGKMEVLGKSGVSENRKNGRC